MLRKNIVAYLKLEILVPVLVLSLPILARAQASYLLQDGINRAPTAALVIPNSSGIAGPPSVSNPLVVGAMPQAVTFASCSGTIAATNVPQLVTAANALRHYLVIDNTSAAQMEMGLSTSVTSTNGLPLYANGGGYEWAAVVPTNAMYVVGTAGSQYVCWQG